MGASLSNGLGDGTPQCSLHEIVGAWRGCPICCQPGTAAEAEAVLTRVSVPPPYGQAGNCKGLPVKGQVEASAYNQELDLAPERRLCLPRERGSSPKHTEALCEPAGLCPGAHGAEDKVAEGQDGCSTLLFQLAAKPPLEDF